MAYRDTLRRLARKYPPLGRIMRRNELLEQQVRQLDQRNEQWAQEVRELRGENQTRKIIWPVTKSDLIKSNPLAGTHGSKRQPTNPPYTVNWVLPPTGDASGGMGDILRCIQYLERKGHTCRIYFYDPLEQTSLAHLKSVLLQYPTVKAALHYNAKTLTDCDAIFATNWYTAYPVHTFSGPAKKFYFIQDYEPYFDPAGSYSTLARNTYELGLHGIVLGRWLHQKLPAEHQMKCDYFDFGIDPGTYTFTNRGPRRKVFFYARPVTPRRGFELGMLALELFHAQHPEYEIHLLGWDLSLFQISFPYVGHGVMTPQDLNQLYNECAAGLVFSFTNMSLLPLEMLAAGCVPVINEAAHTHMVAYESYIEYTVPNPTAVAEALNRVVSGPARLDRRTEAAEFAQTQSWDATNQVVEEILHRELSR